MHIKVAIFEDNKRFRGSLEQLINSAEAMVSVGSFANADRIIDKLQACQPDVIMMDISMPGLPGIEAVKMIREHFPAMRILMQTVFDENDKIFAAICAGASGYMLKKTTPLRMLEAIRETNEGGAPMTPGVAAKVLQMFRVQNTASNKELILLSEREKEILALLVQGKPYKAIAAACYISPDTVNTHVRHIYEKLHVHSKSEAVAKAIFQKLV